MTELTPERWQQISDYLDRLLAVDPDERRAWLDREVADPTLRAEVERFAAGAARTSGVLEDAAGVHIATLIRGEGLVDPAAGEDVPEGRIGPYQVVREVGRGGMGIVYLAERADGVAEHRVALKLVRPGFDSGEIVRRFEGERRIVARLEHPAIARLLDGGMAPDGRPYFAMEFVDGEPLTAYCDRVELGIEGRLRLFHRVCEAVQYAHGRLVVHRDLKPSNILVTADGELKLVDFGIAKLLSDDGEAADLTAPGGQRPLTPAYAAPEQLLGEPVTAATDVYALGVVLFELLSGRRPFEGRTGSGSALERAILETEPPAPSRAAAATAGDGPQRSTSLAAARKLPPAALARRLAGDLDAIVLMALRKQPERRYPSAQALGDDVERHLLHQPIRARAEGVLARAAKFVRRHRVGVAASVLLLLTLATGLAGTLWQARQKALEAAKARQVKEFVLGLFEAADPALARGEEITARELVEQGANRIERQLAGQPEVQAEMDLLLGTINDKLGASEAALALLERSLERSGFVAGTAGRKLRADALRAQGAALSNLGKAAEAEPVLLEAAAEHRRIAGADDAEVAEDLDWLSIALRTLGRLDESERAARRSFELRLAAFGPDHLKVADSYNNLAVLERERGEFDAAEANYRKALAIRIPAIGTEHPETANTLNNLAALLYHRGRYADAEPAFREVTAIYARLYGERHPRTVTGQNNLATVLLRLGELESAEELYESVLAYWRDTAGERHPNALMTRGNLGLLYQLRGEPRRAEENAASVVEGTTEVLGAEHPVTAIFGLRLAAASRELGDVESARGLAGRSLGLLEKVYGPQHQHVAAALEELGRCELEAGRSESAVERLRRAVEIRVASASEEAFETLAARVALAGALRSIGDLDGAQRLLSADLTTARRVLPAGHPILIDLLLELGTTLGAAGRGREAVPLLEEGVTLAAARYGADNWRTGMAELRLAEELAGAGRSADARTVVGRARPALAGSLGEDHPLVRAADRLRDGSPPASSRKPVEKRRIPR